MIEELNAKNFSACLHTMFHAASAGGPVPLELVDVTESQKMPQWEEFSLIFRGPLTPFLPQQVHHLDHAELGAMDIFLVPLGPENGRMIYQAVFNRVRRQA